MKKRRNIFLDIILLLFVLFFSFSDTHPNSEKQRYYLEHASGSYNLENKISHNNDPSEEDQMDQSQIMFLPEKPECQKYNIKFLTLPNSLFDSVWQPPKVF